MKRRGILTALLAAPIAALTSTAFGLGRRRRIYCTPGPGYGIRPVTIEDILITKVVPDGGMPDAYNISVRARVVVPNDVGDPAHPPAVDYYLDSAMGVYVRVDDVHNRVPVFDYKLMTFDSGSGYFKLTDEPVTLAPDFSLVPTVKASIMATEYTEGPAYPDT